jgi:hypothetical protein
MKHINEYSNFKKSLNEGPGKGYYIKVAVRDARKALAILDDMYRKKFDINGSNVYYFKDEDMAYDAKMDLAARDIEIIDTNIEESLDEDADPCWDDYKIGSPKTKISSKSGKRVNNCVPKDESEVNEAKFVKSYDTKVNDAETKKDILKVYPKAKFFVGKLTHFFGELEPNLFFKAYYAKYYKEDTGKSIKGDFKITSVYSKKGSKYVELINESEVNEATDMNDPVLMAFRATRKDLPKFTPTKAKTRRLSFDKYMDLLDSQTDIDQDIKDKAQEMAQTFRDMEQEAEPEGGEIADKYGSTMMKQEKEYTQLKAKKAKIDARVEKYRMS